MSKMFNRARMTITSTGTGALTLGVAVTGYQTFSSAGVSNGDTVSYTIEDGVNWECGTGVFTLSGTTLSRTVTQSYNGSTYGTSPISVTTSAQVFITALAADLQSGTAAGNLVALDGSAKLPAVDGSQLTNVPVTATNFTGTLPVSKGGTGLTSLTAGYIPYGNGTGAFSSSANFLYNGVLNLSGSDASIYLTGADGNQGLRFLFNGSDEGYLNSTRLSSGTYQNLGLRGQDGVRLYTNGSERMRITSAGNVGIGTTSPAQQLVVSNSGAAGIEISPIATGSSPTIVCYNRSSSAYVQLTTHALLHDWTVSGAQAMRLDASGNLGIGTTVGTYRLEARQASSAYWNNSNGWAVGAPAAITITNSNPGGYDPVFIGQMTDSGGTAKNVFAIGAVGTASWTAGNNASQISDFYIATRNASGGISERMRIDASGNVGIGAVATAGYQLDVVGAIRSTSGTAFVGQNSTTTGANVMRLVNNSGSAYFGVDNSTGGAYGTGAAYSAFIYTNYSAPICFISNGVERARFNAGAPILCLSGGNTSATGTGIAFPATQSASSDVNTLDDYEEGTFSVTISGSGAPTISSQQNNYIKIGKIVHVNIRLAVRIGTATGGQTFVGLPYPASTTYTNYRASGCGYWDNTVTSIISSFCTLTSGATTLYGYRTTAASTSPNIWSAADWQSASDSILIFTITYWTDA